MLGGEALQGLAGLAVSGVFGERLRERREGALHVAGAGLLEGADLAQELGALGEVGGGRDPDVERDDQAVPIVEVAVDGLEDLDDREADRGVRVGDALQRADGLFVVAALFDDVAQRADGALGVTEAVDAQAAQAEAQRAALVRVDRVEDATLQELAEVAPRFRAREQVVETPDRLGVGGVGVEDGAVVLDGPREVVERALVIRDLELVALALVRVARLARPRRGRASAAPGVTTRALQEGLEGAEDLGAGRVEGERAVEVPARRGGVAHALVEHLRGDEREVGGDVVVDGDRVEGLA
ncbi:MAG: hypothetical protein U0325_14375 [Polyangiales bacterium]